MSTYWIDQIKWDGQGLLPCVVQDHKDHAVLMVAYMNKESLLKTLTEGKVCFWSRSRGKLWLKGEESGNFQVVKRVFIDCDLDCLVVEVDQIGGAACHTGMRSCFYRQVDIKDGSLVEVSKRVFDPKDVYHSQGR